MNENILLIFVAIVIILIIKNKEQTLEIKQKFEVNKGEPREVIITSPTREYKQEDITLITPKTLSSFNFDNYRNLMYPMFASVKEYPQNKDLNNIIYEYDKVRITLLMSPIVNYINVNMNTNYRLSEILEYRKLYNYEYIRMAIHNPPTRTTRVIEGYFNNNVLEHSTEFQADKKIKTELSEEEKTEKYNWFNTLDILNYSHIEHQYQNQPMDYNPKYNTPNIYERAN